MKMNCVLFFFSLRYYRRDVPLTHQAYLLSGRELFEFEKGHICSEFFNKMKKSKQTSRHDSVPLSTAMTFICFCLAQFPIISALSLLVGRHVVIKARGPQTMRD